MASNPMLYTEYSLSMAAGDSGFDLEFASDVYDLLTRYSGDARDLEETRARLSAIAAMFYGGEADLSRGADRYLILLKRLSECLLACFIGPSGGYVGCLPQVISRLMTDWYFLASKENDRVRSKKMTEFLKNNHVLLAAAIMQLERLSNK